MKKNIFIFTLYSFFLIFATQKNFSNSAPQNNSSPSEIFAPLFCFGALYYGSYLIYKKLGNVFYKKLNVEKKPTLPLKKYNTPTLEQNLPIVQKNLEFTIKKEKEITFEDIFIDKKTKELLLAYSEKILFDLENTITNIFCLYGLPGTDKTNIIKAIAHELDVPLLIIDPLTSHQKLLKITSIELFLDSIPNRPCIIHLKNIERMSNQFISDVFFKFISSKNSYKGVLFTCSCNNDYLINSLSMHKNEHIKFFIINLPEPREIEGIIENFIKKFNIKINFDIPSIAKILHHCSQKDIYIILKEALDKKRMNSSENIILEGDDIIQELKRFHINNIIVQGKNDDSYTNKMNTGLKEKENLCFVDAINEDTITFESVIGNEYIKKELSLLTNYLVNPEQYKKLGLKPPKGILFYGPPGCGKTFMARALAGEINKSICPQTGSPQVKFIIINGSDFSDKWVGSGAKKMRETFELARAQAPCIVFIDEIDSVATKRGDQTDSAQKDFSNTVNQLLVEMDGFEKDFSGVLVIGSTNRFDVLDPAVQRRFPNQYSFELPNKEDRKKIVEHYLKNDITLVDPDFTNILAAKTSGFSADNLQNLANFSREAAYMRIYSENKNQEIEKIIITQADLIAGLNRFMIGIEIENHKISEQGLYQTSLHEIGHTLCILLQENHPYEFDLVTIKPFSKGEGTILGHTSYYLKDEFQYRPFTKDEFLQRIIVCYGGMVAEELLLTNHTAGVINDLEHASQIAVHMVLDVGMAEKLLLSGKGNIKDLNEDERSEIEAILHEAKTKCYDLLSSHKNLLIELTQKLLEKKTLLKAEILELIKKYQN